MKYSVYRTIRKIWSKKAIYIIIASLLATGVNLFCQSFDKYFIEKNNFDVLVAGLTDVSATIDANLVSSIVSDREAVDYKDYVYLKKLYSEKADFKYNLIGKLGFVWLDNEKDDSQLADFNVVFTDKEEMEKILKIKVDDDQYYAGDMVLKCMSQISKNKKQNLGTKLSPASYLSLSGDHIELKESALNIDGQLYKLNEIPESAQENRIITGFSNSIVIDQGIKAEDCIFIPLEKIEMKEKLWPHGSQGMQSRLTIKEKEFGNSVAFKVINYLSDKNSGVYTYNIGNEYLSAKARLDYVTSVVKSYMIISCLQILLVSFCSSGIFLIIFSKRKKDIAISIMLGSTLKQQVTEVLLEITVVVLAGVLSGLIGFYIFRGNNAIMQLKTLFVLMAASIGIITISASLTLKDVRGFNSLEVLQKN